MKHRKSPDPWSTRIQKWLSEAFVCPFAGHHRMDGLWVCSRCGR